MKIRLKIDSHTDRQNMINALANSGIPVHIEKETSPTTVSTNYYVVFDHPELNSTLSP